jgi:hypothetical protein
LVTYKIREILDGHGRSQADFANASGVSISIPYINNACLQKLTPVPKTQGEIYLGLNELTGKKYTLNNFFNKGDMYDKK